MGEFRYEAENEQGERVTGELSAETLAEAERQLRASGLEPLNVEPV